MNATETAKHTPSPWVAMHDADGDYAIFGGDTLIAVTNADSEMDEANAYLLAAAPELLRCCQLALDAFEKNWAIDWDDLRQAINKARGL